MERRFIKINSASFEESQFNKTINALDKEIGLKKKANKEDPCAEELEKKAAIQKEQEQAGLVAKGFETELNKLLGTIGNIVHESVPTDNNEDNNTTERTWG